MRADESGGRDERVAADQNVPGDHGVAGDESGASDRASVSPPEREGRRARLDHLVGRVGPPTGALEEHTWAHLDRLTKPPRSLGRLEELAVRLARIAGDPPPPLQNRTVFVLGGDHGVTGRGVSAYPSEVTAQMVDNIAAGGAAVCALARQARCQVVVADLGIASAGPAADGVVDLRVRAGTDDLTAGPAMTADDAVDAVLRGAFLVACADPSPDVVCLGEMGIGNSTSAAALTALLTGCDPDGAVGAGTGVSGRALDGKREAVRTAVTRVGAGADPLEALRQVGGLEIAGLVGVTLEAAARRVPVLLDGFIATAAALVAVRLAPPANDFLLASHRSVEPGHGLLLDELGLTPLLELDLRLGEGTGAVLALPLLDAAGGILRDMATFDDAGVSGPATPEDSCA